MEEALASEIAASQAQQESVYVVNAREQAGVSGDSSHSIGVIVIDFTATNAATPRALSGRYKRHMRAWLRCA
jgi:hypothetical protein